MHFLQTILQIFENKDFFGALFLCFYIITLFSPAGSVSTIRARVISLLWYCLQYLFIPIRKAANESLALIIKRLTVPVGVLNSKM